MWSKQKQDKTEWLQWIISQTCLWMSEKWCTLQVNSELAGLLHNTGSLLEDLVSVWAYCLLQCVGLNWGYLIAAVTMAAAARVMRERQRESDGDRSSRQSTIQGEPLQHQGYMMRPTYSDHTSRTQHIIQYSTPPFCLIIPFHLRTWSDESRPLWGSRWFFNLVKTSIIESSESRTAIWTGAHSVTSVCVRVILLYVVLGHLQNWDVQSIFIN